MTQAFTPTPSFAPPSTAPSAGDPFAPGPPPAGGTARLTRPQKAAIIVRLLLRGGADLPLGALPEGLQGTLTDQMARLRLVDRQTLAGVAAEFAEAVDAVGLAFPGGLSGALEALDGQIDPGLASRLRRSSGVPAPGDPWQRLGAETPDSLRPLAETEAEEIAAVLLSKLEVGKAAAVLAGLPGPRARRLALAMSRTGAVTPEAVLRIGRALVARLDARPPLAFSAGPEARMGAILNFAEAGRRDEVLEALDAEAADFAAGVRKAIFTFADIPARIDPGDVPRILRGVDGGDLITAMAGAGSEALQTACEFLLANMSRRMADQLREQVAEAGTVKPRDAEAAQTIVVGAIRELQQAGEITFLEPEDPPEG